MVIVPAYPIPRDGRHFDFAHDRGIEVPSRCCDVALPSQLMLSTDELPL